MVASPSDDRGEVMLPKLKSFDRVIVLKNGERTERVVYPDQFRRHPDQIRLVEQTGLTNDVSGGQSLVLEVWRPTRRCEKITWGSLDRMKSVMLVYQHREYPEGKNGV